MVCRGRSVIFFCVFDIFRRPVSENRTGNACESAKSFYRKNEYCLIGVVQRSLKIKLLNTHSFNKEDIRLADQVSAVAKLLEPVFCLRVFYYFFVFVILHIP